MAVQTVFISGHLDLTPQEFVDHYVLTIDAVLAENPNVSFVVGDSHGADVMAQHYLHSKGVTNVTVYYIKRFGKPLNNPYGYPTNGEYNSHNAKDSAMTRASQRDIAWIRPGREDSGTGRNVKRRQQFITSS
jgi:hypothetical protein